MIFKQPLEKPLNVITVLSYTNPFSSRCYEVLNKPIRHIGLPCSYPRVLINPFVDPSAYREQMSPICRKLDILSDMSVLKSLDKVKHATLLAEET